MSSNYTEDELSGLTVVALRHMLKELSLKTGGVKSDLVHRIIEHQIAKSPSKTTLQKSLQKSPQKSPKTSPQKSSKSKPNIISTKNMGSISISRKVPSSKTPKKIVKTPPKKIVKTPTKISPEKIIKTPETQTTSRPDIGRVFITYDNNDDSLTIRYSRVRLNIEHKVSHCASIKYKNWFILLDALKNKKEYNIDIMDGKRVSGSIMTTNDGILVLANENKNVESTFQLPINDSIINVLENIILSKGFKNNQMQH